jgi:hypothetical protein
MKNLTIAIFGNTNNYPLLLASGLKGLGHNVRLIINRTELLHRPEARYPEWEGAYPDWVHDCSNLTDIDIAYQTPAINQAIHHLTHNVDLAILNDTGPALAHWLRSPHVAMLTGSDLAYYASFDLLDNITRSWDPEFRRSSQGRRDLLRFAELVARQREGILTAETVCYSQRGLIPDGDRQLDSIGVQDHRRLMIYCSNLIDLQPRPAGQNQYLRILCGSRLVYKRSRIPAVSTIDFKGNDILIKGFAIYIRKGGRGELRLPRKGEDVENAIELITELGIEKHIGWLEVMPLAQFYEEMVQADLICDQFGSSFPGMVTADAYAMSRPVMANFRNEVLGQYFPEPLPGFDAKSPEQVAEHLISFELTKDLLVNMGKKSRAYAEKYLCPRRMAQQLLNTLGDM